MTAEEGLVPSSGWYAVRCIFESNWPGVEPGTKHRYEERITLWRASSIDEAIALAEVEAIEFAGTIDERPDRYLEIAQAYDLSDPPAHGSEVFSLMRSSDLEADAYVDTFFDTGFEHQNGRSPGAHLDG